MVKPVRTTWPLADDAEVALQALPYFVGPHLGRSADVNVKNYDMVDNR